MNETTDQVNRQQIINEILMEDEKNNSNNYYKMYSEVSKQLQESKASSKFQEQYFLKKTKEMEAKLSQQEKEIKRLRLLNQKSKLILKQKQPPSNQINIKSSAQLKQRRIKQKNWHIDDIVKNLRIRSISNKAYEMCRLDRNVPRPTVRTLQRWATKFDCQEGILFDILRILKDKSETLDKISRLCVLMFDEMSVDSNNVHDSSVDKIYENSKAQVILLRGLYSDWKQPIFFNFDTKVDKALLFSVIMEVEKSGFSVCACVSDLGPENGSLWKSLDIREGNVQFSNPFDVSRNIFVFADVPHCLKNMRNHIIDDGVILDDKLSSPNGKTIKPNTIIDKSLMKDLVSKNEIYQVNPNLTSISLNVTGPERMRVRPAVQFFSAKTSALAQIVCEDNPAVAEFFQTFNDGFDVFNSQIHEDKRNPLKSALGVNLESQKAALLKLRNLLYRMKFRTKTGNLRPTFLPSQLGFILAIDAVLLLFEELKKLYGIEFIITNRLTQDILESFFSLIRSLGGPNTHPSPPMFRFRLRLIILGSKLKPPRGCNTEVQDTDFSYISSELMQKNNMDKLSLPDNSLEDLSNFIVDQENEEESNTIVEEEATRQLAVYLWPKLKKVHQLQNKESPVTSKSTNINFISPAFPHLAFIQPTVQFIQDVQVCESVFNKLFSVLKNKNSVSRKIANEVVKYNSQLNTKFVNEFVRIRLRMKIKFLNAKRIENKMLRRNSKKKAEFVKSQKLGERISKNKKSQTSKPKLIGQKNKT